MGIYGIYLVELVRVIMVCIYIYGYIYIYSSINYSIWLYNVIKSYIYKWFRYNDISL
jgi:hypothetical protein